MSFTGMIEKGKADKVEVKENEQRRKVQNVQDERMKKEQSELKQRLINLTINEENIEKIKKEFQSIKHSILPKYWTFEDDKKTVLNYLIDKRNIELMNYLIYELKLDVNEKNGFDEHPLQYTINSLKSFEEGKIIDDITNIILNLLIHGAGSSSIDPSKANKTVQYLLQKSKHEFFKSMLSSRTKDVLEKRKITNLPRLFFKW